MESRKFEEPIENKPTFYEKPKEFCDTALPIFWKPQNMVDCTKRKDDNFSQNFDFETDVTTENVNE